MEEQLPAALGARRLALCRYARKATLDPERMEHEDLAPLRAAGLGDEALLTLTHVIGFFNGVNRVAACLAVDLEPDMPDLRTRSRRAGAAAGREGEDHRADAPGRDP